MSHSRDGHMSKAYGMIPELTERPCKHVGFHDGGSSGCFHSWPGANESFGTGVRIGRTASSLKQSGTRGLPSVLASPAPEVLDVTLAFLHTRDLPWVLSSLCCLR